MNTYQVGDVPRVYARFQSESLIDHDPTTVKCTIEEPDGTQTTYVYGTDPELEQTATGRYKVELDAIDAETQAGVWHYRWWSEGTGKASDFGSFEVEQPAGAI